MLKTLKRKIALVAVAALGSAGLAVVSAPTALAAAGAGAENVIGDIESLRKDDTTYVATIGAGTGTAVKIRATEAAINDFKTNKVKVGYKATSTSTEILLSTVNAALAPAGGGVETETMTTGVTLSYDNGTNGTCTFGAATAGVYTIACGVDADTVKSVIDLNIARNAIPGIYTLYVGNAADPTVFKSDSIAVTNAPTTITVRKAGSSTATSATLTGDGTQNYDIKVTDGSRPTYLIGSERVDLAVSGGTGSGVTVTAPALSSIGAGDLTSAVGAANNAYTAPNYAATLTAATASGSYTLTASAFGWTATAATGTLTAVSTANVKNATKLEWSGATTASSVNNAYTVPLDSDSTAGAAAANIAAANANVTNYIPTSVRTLKFKATFAAATTGDAQFTIIESTLADLTTGTINLVTIGADATAEVSYTVTNANAAEGILVGVTSAAGGAGQVLELAMVYANAATGKVTISPDAADIAVKSASEVTLGAAVVDIFGRPFPLQTVTLTSTGGSRNASLSLTEVTDAAGSATFKYTDASTSTTNLQDVVTLTSGGKTDAINVNFAGDTTPATVTLVAQQPGTPNTTQTYDTTITAVTTRSVTVDTLLGNADEDAGADGAADEQIKDQVLLTATVKNAAATNVSGVPVVWTGSDGVWFLAGNVVANVPNTTTLSGKTTITNYTAAGTAAAQVSFTKAGTATITAKAGDITSTWTITVKAGSAGIITASAKDAVVTATVTDLFGNPVSGVDVTFSAATGATLGAGTSSIAGKTNATGVVTAVASAVTAGDYAIGVSMTGGDSAVAADTTNGMPAGVASATATAKVAATSAVNAATETAINAVKTDVKAVSDTVATLSKAVTTIQSSVTELTSSFSAQIKSLSAAIAKISKAIAALSKKIK
jgi:hypothetical protein